MLYQITVTEHDGSVSTRIRIACPKRAQELRTLLLRELESQVTISEPDSDAVYDARSQNERARARKFIAMVL